MGHHKLYFTLSFIFVMFLIFFIMCAQFPTYYNIVNGNAAFGCMSDMAAAGRAPYGYREFLRWVAPGVSISGIPKPRVCLCEVGQGL